MLFRSVGFATNADRESTLRTLAWHRSNDYLREGVPKRSGWQHESEAAKSQFVQPSQAPDEDATASMVTEVEVRDNLVKLAAMLDERLAEDRLKKIEILRELGDFEAALGLLDAEEWPGLYRMAWLVRRLCIARDRQVRLVQGRDMA